MSFPVFWGSRAVENHCGGKVAKIIVLMRIILKFAHQGLIFLAILSESI
ncbi:MAG: hypothetical protein R3B84_00735 [Zavarzinella sp.]